MVSVSTCLGVFVLLYYVNMCGDKGEGLSVLRFDCVFCMVILLQYEFCNCIHG